MLSKCTPKLKKVISLSNLKLIHYYIKVILFNAP